MILNVNITMIGNILLYIQNSLLLAIVTTILTLCYIYIHIILCKSSVL